MSDWASDAFFYHIYPLGLCGAPRNNDFGSPPVERLNVLHGWLDHIKSLGANALYLGPVFESTSHGYDTVNYYTVDRRLGTNETLTRLCQAVHAGGFRIILDGVFNHVGRDFWAFKDVLAVGEKSKYRDWFANLSFGKRSPRGDPFSYEGWSGHYDLVKLDLRNPRVKEHVFGAVETWAKDFDVDGLRLDAADVMDIGFLGELTGFCRKLRPDFWLLGEVVHGDYRRWVNPSTIDSVTNYECYKGLYSSHVDRNYFEIAYSLNRQFGAEGWYRGLPLYSFADNHDVDRVASRMKNPAHLRTLYCLLFTMPGAPSVYYGSEWGIEGKKDGSDHPLRPALDLDVISRTAPHRELAVTITRLAEIRRASAALRRGDYTQLHVSHEQLAFSRRLAGQSIVVAVNAADTPSRIPLELPRLDDRVLVDLLNPGDQFPVRRGKAIIEPMPPFWARILEVR